MATAVSVHVGVNTSPWAQTHGLGRLRGSEDDAVSMSAVAREAGIGDRTVLTGENATVANVKIALSYAAASLAPDGFLFVSLSGHGIDLGRGGVFDEELDQGLVVYGGPVCDDCISDALSKAVAGSKILLVIDACHGDSLAAIIEFPDPTEDLVSACQGCEAREIESSALIFAACGADQAALDGSTNSLFTSAILAAWNHGEFEGDYDALYDEVAAHIKSPCPILRFYRDRNDPSFRHSEAFRPPSP